METHPPSYSFKKIDIYIEIENSRGKTICFKTISEAGFIKDNIPQNSNIKIKAHAKFKWKEAKYKKKIHSNFKILENTTIKIKTDGEDIFLF